MDYAQISLHPATEDDVPFLLALRQEAMDATWLRTRLPVGLTRSSVLPTPTGGTCVRPRA